ncbi:NAD-dependent epimerase/dehydratase family protein [Bradyrhizobium sp. i1.15.2]|uniref:NAD-dependent epimerase/dehydratase family protein n=1 Tax=Bradyrhizobium sp. i1.15.2 TaxID=3156362 RepID=UPI0033928147
MKADAVVHLAARVHHKHEEHAVQLYRNVNVAGTLHLARSAATAGVRQFIFIRTVSRARSQQRGPRAVQRGRYPDAARSTACPRRRPKRA